MRKITAILLVTMLILTMVPTFAAENQSRLDQIPEEYNPSGIEPYVFIHGEEMPLEMHGYYDDMGNLMLPLRETAETIGYEVNWNGDNQSIIIIGNTFYTEIMIGVNSYYFARVAAFPLESAPMLISGTTYVPVSFFTDVMMTSAYVLEDGNIMINSPMMNYVYRFYDDEDGFEFGFADIPLDYLTSATYDIDMGYSEIPVEGSNEMGLYLDGDNHSDDMFLYVTKEIENLAPNQMYKYNVDFDLATNVAGGLFGIGGSPGESVYVKAGVSTEKPMVEVEGDYYRLNNVDKSNQSQSGEDLIVVTNVSKIDGSEDDSYAYKDVTGTGYFVSDEYGKAHLTIGFDSGFEGATKLYIDNVKLDVYEGQEEFETVGEIQKIEGNTVVVQTGDIMEEYDVMNSNLDEFYLYQMAGITMEENGNYMLKQYYSTNLDNNFTTNGDYIYEESGMIKSTTEDSFVLETMYEDVMFYGNMGMYYDEGTNVTVDYVYMDEKNMAMQVYNEDSVLNLKVDSLDRKDDGTMVINSSTDNGIEYILYVGSGTKVNFNLAEIQNGDYFDAYVEILLLSYPSQGTPSKIVLH